MKHIITIALFFLFYSAYGACSDSTGDPTFTFFAVNNELHYFVDSCTPGSNAAFYSKPWGGHLLRVSAVDASGSLTIVTDTSFTPAFVLNNNKANRNGIKGKGKIAVKQPVEFTVQDMAVATHDNTTEIYWKGQVYNEAIVYYDLVLTKNGVDKVIATYKGNTNTQYYNYTGVYDKDAVHSIRVVSTVKGLRYQAPLSNQSDQAQIKIYPTEANTFVNIFLPGAVTANTYTVVDMQGKIVQNGTLQTGKNKLQINELLPGNYIVFVPGCAPGKIVIVH